MAQRSSTTAFAKSTRPELAGVIARRALFARLDGTAARTVAWIAGPPGFGKTTLAASYLEERSYRWAWYQVDDDDDDGQTFFHFLAHAMSKLLAPGGDLPTFGTAQAADLAAFARRFFRALFAAAVGPVALVLDNLHALRADSPLRLILEAGLPQLPRQCCVIVTSREAPPPSLARLQTSGAMVCLGADDLRMNAAELGEMSALRGRPLSPAAIDALQQRAEGWAAALVLMLEHDKLAGSSVQGTSDASPQAVFNYLAGEIFERFDALTQRLLLQLCVLPRVTIEVARALTGEDSAARILINLAHNDYFVRELVNQDSRVFVLHSLLREFLRHRAERDMPQALAPAALRRAALLLREQAQDDDAVPLLIACKDWPELAAVALAQAPTLLSQGRHGTLASWLDLLPPHLLATRPELMHTRGLALAEASPRVARRCFEEAYKAFKLRPEPESCQPCCVGVITAILNEFDDLTALDHWLAEFDQCSGGRGDSLTQPPAVLLARLWRDPGHSSVVRQRFARDSVRNLRLEVARSAAAWLAADFARSQAIASEVAIEVAGGGGATALALAISDTLCALVDGQAALAVQHLQRGVAIAELEAIHGHDPWLQYLQVAVALLQGDLRAAQQGLDATDRRALRRGDRALNHQLRAWVAGASGERGQALREARHATELAVEAGLTWVEGLARVTTAQLLAEVGDRVGADAQIRAVQALAQRLGSSLLQLAAQFTQAAVALASGDEAAALVPLHAALVLSRDLGVCRVPGLTSDLMGTLCAAALRHGMAVEQARLLVSAGRLPPPLAALRLRRWPWAFELSTLGGFGLQRSGQAIEFSAKGPGRPVELLKVLISLGGENVRADLLADALWPHVDADYAHKSFTATLHRLRRIFGADDTLRLSDGRLSLNAGQFWLDTWALDHLLEEIDRVLRADELRAADRQLHVLVDESLALYRGPFLPDEAEQPAYIARREQLRARVLHAFTRCARRWEEAGNRDAAVDCYLRSVQADELCEAFYRNLMLCYQRHGDAAAALATYERLRAVLAARLKSVPSPETQTICDKLRA
jgi:ATP/maltotriose-dependent transcriptional regulator MalT